MTDSIEIVLCNELAEVERLRQSISEFCKPHCVPEAIIFHFQLACDEAVTNTISYGYGDDAKNREIRVRMNIENNMVFAEIRDDARHYDPLTAPEPQLDADVEDRPIGGLGVYFIKTFMDTVQYHRTETHNCLSFSKKITKDT